MWQPWLCSSPTSELQQFWSPSHPWRSFRLSDLMKSKMDFKVDQVRNSFLFKFILGIEKIVLKLLFFNLCLLFKSVMVLIQKTSFEQLNIHNSKKNIHVHVYHMRIYMHTKHPYNPYTYVYVQSLSINQMMVYYTYT